MFSHVMVGSNDIERAKTFYDALFTAIGGKPGRTDDKGRLSYLHKGAAFMVSKPIDGREACHANGGTIGFTMDSPEQVHAWHEAGTANGGTTCEDPPGPPPGQLRPPLPRLPPRPRRQQALRAASHGGVRRGAAPRLCPCAGPRVPQLTFAPGLPGTSRIAFLVVTVASAAFLRTERRDEERPQSSSAGPRLALG